MQSKRRKNKEYLKHKLKAKCCLNTEKIQKNIKAVRLFANFDLNLLISHSNSNNISMNFVFTWVISNIIETAWQIVCKASLSC